MNEKLRVLDLFSGIGGFSLGLERTGGFETVAFCEIAPYCRAVLRKHWPDVRQYDDVRTAEWPRADVITGGFPCQDISRAGERAGITGERSGLWRELVGAIRLVRPRYAIVENVAAILDGDLGVVLGDLAEIGYDAEWHCIPAEAVGARHQRDRLWLLSYPQCDGIQGGPAVAAPRTEFGRAQQLPRFLFASVVDAVSAARVWRADHGVSARLDVRRNMGVGNTVLPQIPEIIGRAILEAERQRVAA